MPHTLRGFSLNKVGLLTVTLTKYLISASPGNPLSVGGSSCFTCLVEGFETSKLKLAKLMPTLLLLFPVEQVLLKGS